MKNDFFTYSRRKIEKDKEEGRFDAAHNREMTLRCFINFLGKEKLPLNELTPGLMVNFEESQTATPPIQNTYSSSSNQ